MSDSKSIWDATYQPGETKLERALKRLRPPDIPCDNCGEATCEDYDCIKRPLIEDNARLRAELAAKDAELAQARAELAEARRDAERELTKTIDERDYWESRATELAEAVGLYLNIDVGEHSNMNCPVLNAIDAIDAAREGGEHG